MQRKQLARWFGALVLVAAPAMAQQVSVEDFAKYAELDEVALSPTGEYLAIAVPAVDGKETNMQVLRLSDGQIVKTLRFGQESHVRDIVWSGDETITFARAKRFPMEEFTRSMGAVMSTKFDGTEQHTLFAYTKDDGGHSARNRDMGWAFIERLVDNEPGKVLVKFYCWPSQCGEDADTTVYKVDTVNGGRKEVERIKDGKDDSSLLYDHNGIARVAYSTNQDFSPKMSYRPTPTSPWTPLPKSIVGYELDGGVFAADNNILYARISDKGEATQLYKVDLANGTREKIIGKDDVEISDILTGGYARIPFGVTFTAHKPSVQYIDAASPWAQLHAGLMKKFPGKMLAFESFSRDDNKVLFSTWGDRSTRDYYLLDRAAGNKIVQVGSRYPWFEGKAFAAMKPIEFKARDGKTIYGLYTAPAGAGPHPLVVMPHGGPFYERDRWGWDSDVQFLANRGYAVLQVNYRGSNGRGDSFVADGFKQWGGLIQDDITDGVKYVIDQKLVDQDRVCMYGGSFGGYSAMMQPIRNPGMYKCAVGYVGVYDLDLMQRNDETSISDRSEEWMAQTMGNDPAELNKQSPALRAGEIKVPVLLVHGKADDTANMAQFRAMESALQKAGNPAEIFLAPGEGHGFAKPENRAERLRRLQAFLDKYIGPNAKVAKSP